MRHIVLLCLLVTTSLAHANVYKCQLSSKQTTYQDVPCSPDTADKNIVNIETQTPEQKEAALNKLKATEAERQAMDKTDREQQEAAAKAAGQQGYYPYRSNPNYTPHYYNPNYGYRNPYPYVSRGLGGIPSGPNARFPANSGATSMQGFPANSGARSMQGFPASSGASPNFSPFHRR
jgi:hypothetical protein